MTDRRVLRGGSWNNHQDNARYAYRNHNEPNNRDVRGFARRRVSFAEFDASVQGRIEHVRYADT